MNKDESPIDLDLEFHDTSHLDDLTIMGDEKARERFKGLPLCVQDILVRYPGQLVVAGGYLRDIEARMNWDDLDVFILTPLGGNTLNPEYLAHEIPHRDPHKTKNSLTLRCVNGCANLTVQFITLYSGMSTASELLNTFDFACCRVALWHDGANPVGLEDTHFYHDCLEKKLRYRDGDNPANSMRRILKLNRRGWKVPDRVLAQVALHLVGDSDGEEEVVEKLNANNRSQYL